MAYNFLGLVNDVAGRLNEVQLTSSNFSTAVNHYITIKEAINTAIRKINQEEFEWPFNHVSQDDTLVADGTMRYALPAAAKTIDWESFRIQRNGSFGNTTQPLKLMNYEKYLEFHIDDEYNTSDSGIRNLPTHVVPTQDQEYIVVPAPDKAYTCTYEYFGLPTDLSAYDDIPSIPVAFRHVIVEGAMEEMYMFRGDLERSLKAQKEFKKGIKNLRIQYINKPEDIRSGYIPQPYKSSGYLKVN